MKKKPFPFFNIPRGVFFATIIFLGTLLVLYHLTDYSRGVQPIKYSTFKEKVEKGQVRQVIIGDGEIQGVLKDGTAFETSVGPNPNEWNFLRENDVEFQFETGSQYQLGFWQLLPIISLLMTIAALWYFMRQARSSGGSSGGNNVFSLGRSRARMFMPSAIKETFNSVAGAADAKEELRDIVDFLKNPEKYERLGARMTRGILLVGAPGNGKTLLARAMAGEASCPFFSVSGSDFIEVFVGVGAARVRDLFAQARKCAPCIIFIDEIDAVGRMRGSGMSGGHEERDQTLNQLLTEMDGFVVSPSPVIVVAATNRPDVLDPALIRPGRFDRQVQVPHPDLVSRAEILKVHTKNVQLAPDTDLDRIARGTPGFSGADLANLVNEAAINASKKGQSQVTMNDFEEVHDRMVLGGRENKTLVITPEDRRYTAYHEAGHALVGLLMPTENMDPLHKISIIPRGGALGVTYWLPERDKHTVTKDEMLASITAALGGRAAEMLVFNRETTGYHNDADKATRIARDMVSRYGMSDLGPVHYEREHSPGTAHQIDEEVSRIVQSCSKRASQMLAEHRDKLNTLAEALLEKGTLYAGEVYELLGVPPRVEHRFV